MSGFLGIGQSGGQKSDRNMFLNSTNQLNNVFNYAMPQSQGMQKTGAGTTASGVNALGSASGYWQKLLSGSRPALEASVAPERNMIESTGDAARRQQETMGTARGGGTAGANQTQQDTINAQVDQAILGQRAGAATQEAAVGGKIADVGLSQQQEATQLLGLGTESSAAAGSLSEEDYKTQTSKNQQMTSDILTGLAFGLAEWG